MTTIEPSKVRMRVLTRAQMESEIAELTTQYGNLVQLHDKEDRELLTPDERAAMRRLEGLEWLLSRQK